MTSKEKFKSAFMAIVVFPVFTCVTDDLIGLDLRRNYLLFMGISIGYLLCLFFSVPTTKDDTNE